MYNNTRAQYNVPNIPDHGDVCDITYSNRPDRVAQLAQHWASIPKVVGSIPTVARHIFQACPVWICIQSNITKHLKHIMLAYIQYGYSKFKVKKLYITGNSLNIPVSVCPFVPITSTTLQHHLLSTDPLFFQLFVYRVFHSSPYHQLFLWEKY